MDRIQKQASDLWALLFDEETAETYQSALNLTGKILTDTAQLLWLIICSVFVFGAWFSDASVKAGNSIRTWVDQQASSPPAGESKPLSETGKDMLDSSRIAIVKLLNRAREELGLEAEPISESPAKKVTMPTPSAAPTEKTDSASSVAVSSPSAPKTSPVALSSTTPTTTPKSTMVSASSTEDLSDDVDDEDDDETEIESWPPQTADD
ncbi:MAG: hypothetical protein AAF716_13875 [Cyanobacteria bacterium P01_D01_bin.1]